MPGLVAAALLAAPPPGGPPPGYGADLVKALLLGIVEGVTEFLPVSSTGHLVLAGQALDFPESLAVTFEVFIQLGAVLAVAWLYRADLAARLRRLPHSARERRFVGGVLLAFVPAAAVGLLLGDWIVAHLFRPLPVALAQIAGALLILLAETRQRLADTEDLDAVRPDQALLTGGAQILALWPGMSRAGVTIVGGMLAGMDRATATRFSFYVALPTLTLASLYTLGKQAHQVTVWDAGLMAVGFLVSFGVALAVIQALVRFVSRYTLAVFAWYRLALGALVLLLIALGLLPA